MAQITHDDIGIEEIHLKPLLRGWSHVIGFFAAAAIGGVMIGFAPGAHARLYTIIYIWGLCTMLGVSALYHRLSWSAPQLAFMRKLDHSTIFLAISGSYTPIGALTLNGWVRATALGIVWGGTALGITLQWLPVAVPRWLSTAVYAVVGWVALFALPQLYDGLGLLGFTMMIGGGVAYTAGAVVYALRKPDPWPTIFGYHEVFHLLTLIGAGLHLATVAFCVFPRA